MRTIITIALAYFMGCAAPLAWSPFVLGALAVLCLAYGWAEALEFQQRRDVRYVELPLAQVERTHSLSERMGRR